MTLNSLQCPDVLWKAILETKKERKNKNIKKTEKEIFLVKLIFFVFFFFSIISMPFTKSQFQSVKKKKWWQEK